MTEQQIRNLIRQEIYKSNNASRYNGVTSIVDHHHNGIDAPNILAENIIPSTSVVGTIEMATEGRIYTLNLNSSFTPRNVTAYGVVTGTYGGNTIRAITTGSALLTPSFYFQPNDDGSSVVTGNIQYPFPTEMRNGTTPSVPVQSSAYLLASRGTLSDIYALTSENHIVSVGGFPASTNIYARATVIGYNKNSIQIYVPYLTAGWTIFLTVIVT